MMPKEEAIEAQERIRAGRDRLLWLITLRWAGLIGVAAIGAATQVVGFSVLLNPGWLVAPVAAAYNVLFRVWLRRVEREHEAGQWTLQRVQRSLHWQAYLQALCDMIVLCLVVYLNSGVECPILYIPLLAVMLSSVILPRRGVFLQANLGAALLAAMALAEYLGWIDHVYFVVKQYQRNLYRDPRAILSVILSMTAALNLVAYLMSSLGQRLNQAETRTRRLLGQLRRQVKEATGELAEATGNIGAGATEVRQAAEQIAATVQQIALGAAHQAGQLERLSQSLQRQVDAARRVAEGTQETHQASAEAVSTVDRGRQASEEATARMEEIAQVFARAEEALDALSEQSERIAEVALAIDHFAERTDLLALNAGIEAARAAEHGRGFAVVAGEVKKLAASSSASAERVGEMVGQVQQEIGGVVGSVREGLERVRRGQEAIATLRQALEGMRTVIARTDELAGTMEHLSRQQMEAHQEIGRAVEEIAGTAEETAAGAEETAAAVEQQVISFGEFGAAVRELAGLAARLDRAVAGLSHEETTPAVETSQLQAGSGE